MYVNTFILFSFSKLFRFLDGILQSCKTPGVKKRSVNEDDDKFVDLMIHVTGNDTDVRVIGSDVINNAEGHLFIRIAWFVYI